MAWRSAGVPRKTHSSNWRQRRLKRRSASDWWASGLVATTAACRGRTTRARATPRPADLGSLRAASAAPDSTDQARFTSACPSAASN
eukprot:6341926-Alexandrium_andersonii.AAC.1